MVRTFRYEQIADNIREQIRYDKFQNQKLPSERALMAQFGVQRSTIRRALLILEREGQITTSDKRGSFINKDYSNTTENLINKVIQGTVLVITPWSELATALESLLRGLTPFLTTSQLSLLCFDSRPAQGKTWHELPDTEYLIANDVKGIVLWPQNPSNAQALRRLRDFVPLILVDRQVSGFETHSVVFDDFAGGRTVTEHLIGLGHQRIGFLTDESFAETVQQRWRGYVAALEAAGIAPEPNCYGLFQGKYDLPYTEQIRLFLSGGGRPLSAVVCSNDPVAMRLINLLRHEGYRVPEDIAVTGFGNFLPNSMEAIGLTTISQPLEEAGQAVGKILAKYLSQDTHENTMIWEHVEIPVQLVIHTSSGVEEQNISETPRID